MTPIRTRVVVAAGAAGIVATMSLGAQRPVPRHADSTARAELRPRDDSILHIGAVVRVTAPAWGTDTVVGRVVRIVSPRGCLGVLLVPHDSDGRQVILFLPGLTSLAVDYRTNLGAFSDGISMPAPSDWHVVPLTDLGRAEPACERHVGGRLAPPVRSD